MTIIRYFFYKVYKLSLSNGEPYPGWSYAFVTMLLIANITTVNDLIQLLFKVNLKNLGVTAIIVQAIAIMSFVYWYFIMKETPGKIVKEFNDLTSKSKMVLNIYLFAYLSISIFLFIYLGDIIRNI